MPKEGKNIYLRKDGRWEGRFKRGRINGKTQYGYVFGKTFEETEKKLDEVKAQMKTENISDISFKSLSYKWLETQLPLLKLSSVAKYSNILNLYLLPEFGEREISTILRSEVKDFSRKLLVSGGVKGIGLAPKTVNSILSVFKNIFTYAARENKLVVADIADIFVRQPQKPMRILSISEQSRLSRYLCDNLSPCNLGILLCLYTGLRIGEICALKWEDIFIVEQYLYVRKTMQRIQVLKDFEKKTEIVIQPPKSDCSVRKIPIPDEILSLLIACKKEPDAFVLTGYVHSFIEPRNMENRFKAVVGKCNISDVNYHALRHTFATRCVELGFDIKSLSEILGHASVNITLNRYVHPSMDLKQKNMNMLSDLLSKK